jgi:hypothetical protein
MFVLHRKSIDDLMPARDLDVGYLMLEIKSAYEKESRW